MSESMCISLTKVVIVFALLSQIPDFVCSQRYVIRMRNGANARSYSDPTVLKVYPGSGQKYADVPEIVSDAGVPPDAGIPPAVPPESGSYDKPASSDYTPDSVTKDSGDNSYDDDRAKNVPNDEVGANGCICVPYYQCDDGNIITDGSGIIDPRKIKPSEKEIPLESNFKPPFCGSFHVCCSEPEVSTKKPYVHKCGIRNPSGINRRILAPKKVAESEFGEWPWQAAILKFENGVNLFQCGGVLIDHSHVLTVAHCVSNFAHNNEYHLVVRLGEWDTQTTKEFLPHNDYKVVSIAIHPAFRNGSLWNDIALLKLDRKVEFKPHIDSICLPNIKQNFDGMECVTTGWGKNAYKGGSYSNILKEVKLPILNHYQCETALRSTRLGPRFRLHNSFICAGGQKGVDSCKGDGGGPLVCYQNDGSYSLAGLVAWGIDCGKPDVPGVYVQVSKFVDWIAQNTGNQLESYWHSNAGN